MDAVSPSYAAVLDNSSVSILIGAPKVSQASHPVTPAAALAIGVVLVGAIAALAVVASSSFVRA